MKIDASFYSRFASRLFFALSLSAGLNTAQAANKYWDVSAGASNGVGGNGTWAAQATNIFSTSLTGDASLTSAATTDAVILDGTAGIVTLGFNAVTGSVTVNTTGYTITPDASTRAITGNISLASNVNLNLMSSSATAGATLNLNSSVTGASGSSITIQGNQASGSASRVNLNAANVSIAPSIIINATGGGIAGIVGTATGTSLGGTITNNSSSVTGIGATSGNALTLNGKISGTSGVQFSAGASGGAGTVTLNAASDYQGSTTFNAASGALIKLGVDNALPTGTAVTMAASASNGGILDLNGHNQEIASLTSGAGGGSITNGGASGTNTLKISGSASPVAFGLVIADGANAKTAFTRSGNGTTILSGANTYTGATQITGGTLTVSGSLGNTTVTLSNSGSTLSSGVNITSAIVGGVTAGNGTFITPGGAGTVGTFTIGSLTLNNGSTLSMDILGNSNYDKIVTSGTLTLGSGIETINVAGSGFSSGNFTLIAGYTSLSGGVFTLGSTPGGFNYSLATGGTSTVLTIASLGGSGSLTWSVNGLAPTSGTDGAGTWTNGSANFYNTGSNATTTWDNTATNALTIGSGGSGGVITLGGNVRVGGALTFASVTSPYTVGAGNGTNTLTLAGGITANESATINAPTVLETSQTWSVANAKTLTANGAVSETGGARSLFKDGAGTLIIASANNTYSGGTTVNSGMLSISSGSSAGTGNVAVNSGATLAGAGTVKGTTSVTSGTINGTGLTLTGAATFGGAGNSLNGTVTSVGGTVLSGSSDLTVNGTLTVTGNTVGPVAPVGVTINGSNSTLTNLGTISQTGTVATGTGGRGVFNSASTGIVITNGSATNSTALIQTADGDTVRSNVGGVTLNNYGTLTSLNAAAAGSQAVDFNPIASGNNTINNFAGAIMQASEADAVRPGLNGVVNNAGTIKSTWATTSSGSSSDGVDAQNNSGVVITNASNWNAGSPTTPGTGTIEGARDGITGGAGNSTVTFVTTVTNNLGGVIQGDNGSGINLDGFNANQSAIIVNNGTITGNGRDIGNGVSHDGDGVDVDGLVTVTNTGIIRSVNSFNIAADGVAHSEGITVGGGTITNSGTIEGLVSAGNTNAIGMGITFLGNDIATGPLAGTREAIYGNATVNNQAGGLICGDSGSGILVDGAASAFTVTINNAASATIRGGATLAGLGGSSAAIQMGADAATINNAGLIDGSSNGKAITGGSGGLVVNITGGSASVLGDITGAAGVTNSLTINPGAGNTFSYAGAIANFNTTTVASGTFSLAGQLTFALNGTSSYDQLIVNSGGALTLGGGSLINLSLGFTPTVGDQFTLINMVDGSTTIGGAFANLADGSTYTQGGVYYLVSYEGGTGNDLVLTVTTAAIPEPATTGLLFAGLAGVVAMVIRRRRAVRS